MPRTGRDAPRTNWFAELTYSELLRNRLTVVEALKHLGQYSLAALTPEIVAKFRDEMLAGEDRRDEKGKSIPRSNETVRLYLALLGHLFTIRDQRMGYWAAVEPCNEHPSTCSFANPQPSPYARRRKTPASCCRSTHQPNAALDRADCPRNRYAVV